MFNNFTTRELVFIALMSALVFVINFVIGGAVNAATGIPLSSAFFTALIFGVCVIILGLSIPKFGAFTLFLLIYSILEMPTSLGGAPGFWPKIPINAITGLVADSVLGFVRYRKWAIFIAFYVLATVNLLTFAFFLWALGLPGAEKLIKLLPILIGSYWIIGTIGLFIGLHIWKRIKEKRLIRQLKG